MGYGRYIGYVGALAVALGVGSAVATTPGIAYALPAESSSESPSTGESSSAAESSPEPSTTSRSASSETTDGVAVPPGELRGDDLSPSGSATASPEIVSGGDDAPVVVLSSSGGAHTSTSDARDAEELGIAADLPASGKGDANVLPVQIAAAEPPSQDVAAGPDESTRLARSAGEHTPVQKVAARDTDQSVVAAAEHTSPTIGQRVSTLSLAAPIDGPAYSLVAPPTAVVPAPPPTLDEILEEPHTFLVSALAHAVDAVLEVFLAPFGSGSPLQSPMLWTVLAFVRDEFERYFNPHAASSQTTSAVDQGPNLLVNPGAEVGDPSLSGYAAVTIPGWTLTGTPTVIEYGTARRFPVPTSTPGPVLPNILAFPRSDGPIPAAPEWPAILRRWTRRRFDAHPNGQTRCRANVDRCRRRYLYAEWRPRRLPDRPVQFDRHRQLPGRGRGHVGHGHAEVGHCVGSLVFHRVHSPRHRWVDTGQHSQRAGCRDLRRPQPGTRQLQQCLRRQPLIYSQRPRPRTRDTRAA